MIYDASLVERVETMALTRQDDAAIMALLGYDTCPDHRRMRNACRPFGDSRWQAGPDFRSADDFQLWVLDKRKGCLDDIGRDDEGGTYVSYSDPEFGNDYGCSPSLGAAMWAAFVALVGRVDRE